MPTVVNERLTRPAPDAPPRKQWTRAECAVLEASGLLDQQHLELIEGELINKMGENRQHGGGEGRLFAGLVEVFGVGFVNSEAPIDVAPEDHPTSEPEPDLIVVKRSFTKWLSAAPPPEELELVVEIADTTLAYDLTVKA